jgi:hypothetical protein
MAQAPWVDNPGTFRFGVEATYLPDVSDRMATPTTCRPGNGPENWNVATVFLRPRFSFLLGDGVALEASWVPPVRMNGIRPNLWSFSIARTVPFGGGQALFTGRLHATIGSIRAPITCPDEALTDPASPCFGGRRSDDRYSPNVFGVELAITRPLANGRFRPYLGGGYNILHPRFQANFTDALGVEDDQKRDVNLHRWVVFGGTTLAILPGFLISAEAYAAPSDVVTGRLRMTVGLGSGRKPSR